MVYADKKRQKRDVDQLKKSPALPGAKPQKRKGYLTRDMTADRRGASDK